MLPLPVVFFIFITVIQVSDRLSQPWKILSDNFCPPLHLVYPYPVISEQALCMAVLAESHFFWFCWSWMFSHDPASKAVLVEVTAANKVFDKAMKLEQEFGEYFTGEHPEYVCV